MDANLKLSEQIAILASLHSASQAISAVTSTWVSVANFHRISALVDIGNAGAGGTVAVALLQAQDNAGTGSKALTSSISGSAIATAAPVAGGSQVVLLGAKLDDVDANNGYGFVAVQVTVAVAAVQLAAQLIGHAARIAPASQYNAAGVVLA
jgi:hypothetical protein